MKNDLRTALRKKRAVISPLRRSRDSKKIALHILNSTELNLGNRLGLYFALKHEVNTKILINGFLNLGKKIFLPVIEKEKLFFARYDPKITNCESTADKVHYRRWGELGACSTPSTRSRTVQTELADNNTMHWSCLVRALMHSCNTRYYGHTNRATVQNTIIRSRA